MSGARRPGTGMLDRVIHWSLRHRLFVLLLTALVAGAGGWSVLHLPVDAFPDTTPVQVQVNTYAPALSPEEIEQQITFPVEQGIGGLRGLSDVRSISKFGLSQVTAVFEDGTDVYLARQQVMERISAVGLPEGIDEPELGPVSTGLGEVFHYLVSSPRRSLRELTEIHDWEIRPLLRSVPGVAEVNTWGGRRKEYHVLYRPDDLVGYDLTLGDLLDALRSGNRTAGGGYIAHDGEAHLVQGVSLTTTIEEIADVVIETRRGVPIRVRDVADVRLGHELRRGAVTADGEGETVLGLGFLLMGENSREVTARLRERLVDEILPTLPDDVGVEIVYERTTLVDQVLDTVRENLFEGAILVVAVLFAFLGSLRAGLIVALAIPLSMLFAASAMLRFGVAASLMSLGAIDFGLIVDSSVIMVESSVRHLARVPGADARRRLEVVRDASVEVRRPTMFGELIIAIVYLPILTLEGIEGKMFRPMALTVVFALLGSMLLSLTLMPVLSSLLLKAPRSRRSGSEDHGVETNPLVRAVARVYRPLLAAAIRFRLAVVIVASLLVPGGVWLATRTGSEFIPRLSEMSVVISTARLAGVSLDESVRYGGAIEQLLRREFPDEIERIWTRTGTAEVATDAMGLEVSDIFIALRPRGDWTKATSQDELVERLEEALEPLPGMRRVYTQPIEMRVSEMVAGIKADLGVKIFGEDLDVLREKAAEVEAILRSIPGSANAAAEQVTGQPVLSIAVDQAAIGRYGVRASDVLDVVASIGGIAAGEVREGKQRRFALVVRLAEPYRRDPGRVREVLVPTPGGERIPLRRLADVRQVEGPSTITREWQARRIVVQSNVRGRDIASFVAELRERIESDLDLPRGYRVEFGGQFEHLIRAQARLRIVVPLALIAILILLYVSTSSARDAALIFTGAPFAALGGLVALHLRGLPFTISAGVGFVAVCGVAMLNGLVLMSTLRRLQRREGLSTALAIERSALLRLRPVLMTALVASLGFVPMALNTGVGAEVQRPLATVVIGGIVSDNLLTLIVLPALCALFAGDGARRRDGEGEDDELAG